MVGFFTDGSSKMREHKVQCYYGVMVSPKEGKLALHDSLGEVRLTQNSVDSVETEEQMNDNDKVLHADDFDSTLLQIEDEPDDDTNLFLLEEFMMPAKKRREAGKYADFEPREETDLLIETINELDLGWMADTCKLSKGKRGKKCDEPLSLAQTGKFMRSSTNHVHGMPLHHKGESLKPAVEEA